ncbi:MAG: PepSY domain-containing protein [Bryobacteraceae bacterium]
MKFPHFNRRLHLYLALVLLPWFLMYGVSSIPFSHNQYFNELDQKSGIPLWTQRLERPYEAPVPEGNLRPLAKQVVMDLGLAGNYGAYRPPGSKYIEIYAATFLHATRARYFPEEKRITLEDRRFRFDQFLTGMHARGGFRHDGALEIAWSIVIDLFCLAMLLWIASGIYMWWSLPGLRRWGWLALGTGMASFALFLGRL